MGAWTDRSGRAMKVLLKANTLPIPEGITVDIKARVVTVKGSRGTLKRSFKHMPIDLSFTEDKTAIRMERWFTSGKANASIRTCTSAITNKDTRVEIRNFLGEKVIRIVDALGDVTVKRSTDVKDEIVLSGTDIDAVSRTAARVQNICAVKRKDIRKFLDGIYVSYKGNIIED